MPSDMTEAPKQPAQVPPPLVPGLRGLLTLAVGVVLITALYFGREVFVPLVLAVLLSFVLGPVVNLLRRIRLGRVPSVIVAVLLALAVLGGIGVVIGTQVAGLAGNLPQYQSTVQRKFAGLQQGWLGEANRVIAKFSHQVQDATQKADAAGTTAETGPAGETPKAQLVRVQEPELSPLALAEKVLGPVVETADHGPASCSSWWFSCSCSARTAKPHDPPVRVERPASDDGGDGRRRGPARDLLPRPARHERGLRRHRRRGVVVHRRAQPAAVGRAIGHHALHPLHRRHRLGRLSVALAAAVDPGWSMVVATAALFLVAEPFFGQVVEPLLYGHSTGLSPLRRDRLDAVLGVPVGTHRPDPGHPLHGLPRRPRPPRRQPGVPRRPARRPAAPDAGGELLPAHARGRPGRGPGDRRGDAEGALALLVL